MTTPPSDRSHPTALAKCAVMSVLAACTFSGCEKPDGQGGGSSAASADEHADHGEGEAPHSDEVTLTAAAVEQYGVRVEAAQLWALRPTVVAPARVAFNAEAMAHVGSPLRGRALEVKARLGDFVVAGQELVIVESPELGEAQADLLQKKSAVETAAPAIELARIAWERARSLYEQSQGISLTEVQRREAEYKAAIAGQRAAEASAIAARHRLVLMGMEPGEVANLESSGVLSARHVIRAAIDGQVVEREVTPGELVNPDRNSLMVLADTRTLWVLADVPEARLTGIGVGATAWVTVGSTSSSRAIEGTVAFIGPLIDPSTRTAEVRIDVPVMELSLRSGMFAQAEVVLSVPGQDPAPVIAVPDEAIQTVEGGPAVFIEVAGEPGTFARRAVNVGTPVGRLVPVLSGLVEGERFVASGTFILKAELGKSSAEHAH